MLIIVIGEKGDIKMIKINRVSGYDDRLRKYKVFVDDIYLGDIRDGETKEFDVSPGQHTIYLKIDWCRSNKIKFDLNKEEKMVFDCGNATRWYNILLYITFLKNQYLWLETRGKENINGENSA